MNKTGDELPTCIIYYLNYLYVAMGFEEIIRILPLLNLGFAHLLSCKRDSQEWHYQTRHTRLNVIFLFFPIQFDHFLFHLIFYSCVYTYFQERYPFLVLPPARAHTPLADGHIRVPPRDRSSPDTRASPVGHFPQNLVGARCSLPELTRTSPPAAITWAIPDAGNVGATASAPPQV